MGAFSSLQQQKREQSAAPTPSFARPSRSFTPVTSSATESRPQEVLPGPEQAARSGYSIDQLSIFPLAKKNTTGLPVVQRVTEEERKTYGPKLAEGLQKGGSKSIENIKGMHKEDTKKLLLEKAESVVEVKGGSQIDKVPIPQTELATIVQNRLITQLESLFDPEDTQNIYTDEESVKEGNKRISERVTHQSEEIASGYKSPFHVAHLPTLRSWYTELQTWGQHLPNENSLMKLYPRSTKQKIQLYLNLLTNVVSFKLPFVQGLLEDMSKSAQLDETASTQAISKILAVAEVLLNRAQEELKWMATSEKPGSTMKEASKLTPVENEGNFLIARFEAIAHDQSNWVHRYGGQRRGPSFQNRSPMRKGMRDYVHGKLENKEYPMPGWANFFEAPQPNRNSPLRCHVTNLQNKGRGDQREFNILLRDDLNSPVSTRLNLHVVEEYP